MSAKLVYVIHKHYATSKHFDFRIQIGNVMPSWAIPKGPTRDPLQKRLAMKVEDHALSYRTFEGVIAEGEYGAGPVMIWDEGYYFPEIEKTKGERTEIKDFDEAQRVLEQSLTKGEIKFRLYGKKLNGSFALVKTRGFGPKNAWLMIKHKDEFVVPNFNAYEDDISAASGRTMDQISRSKSEPGK